MSQSLLKWSKYLPVITSRIVVKRKHGQEQQGLPYQVLQSLSTGSLMQVLCKSDLICLVHAWPPVDSGVLSSISWTGCEAAIRLSVFVRCDHMAHCMWTTAVTDPTGAGLLHAPIPILSLGRSNQRSIKLLAECATCSLSHNWGTHGIRLNSLYKGTFNVLC